MTFNSLCNSCTNIGCEFQSGIVRTECAFYMPPHIEPDNCGNYVVMQPTVNMLDKIRVEIEEHINYNKKMNYQGIVAGLLLTLDIIDKYKAEKE